MEGWERRGRELKGWDGREVRREVEEIKEVKEGREVGS